MNDVNCKYSNGIVPYMYGELATSAATEFESHLLECQACTDEFAALSAARYEVYDWKKLEFDPLATPAMSIPFEEVASTPWIEKLRAAFASGWGLPAAAFAGLAMVAVLLGIVTSRNTGTEVVHRDVNVPVNMPANTKNLEQTSTAVKTGTEGKVDTTSTERSAPRPTVVRDSPSRRDIRTQPAIAPRPTTPRDTQARAPNAPRLNDFVEEEDNSLRLAELFEDIDTSE